MDILEEYDILIKHSAHKPQLPLLDILESQIYQLLSQEERDTDTLMEELQKNPGELM